MDLHQKCTDSPKLIHEYDYKNNIYNVIYFSGIELQELLVSFLD